MIERVWRQVFETPTLEVALRAETTLRFMGIPLMYQGRPLPERVVEAGFMDMDGKVERPGTRARVVVERGRNYERGYENRSYSDGRGRGYG